MANRDASLDVALTAQAGNEVVWALAYSTLFGLNGVAVGAAVGAAAGVPLAVVGAGPGAAIGAGVGGFLGRGPGAMSGATAGRGKNGATEAHWRRNEWD